MQMLVEIAHGSNLYTVHVHYILIATVNDTILATLQYRLKCEVTNLGAC